MQEVGAIETDYPYDPRYNGKKKWKGQANFEPIRPVYAPEGNLEVSTSLVCLYKPFTNIKAEIVGG